MKRINSNALIINDGICDMLVSYETVVCKVLKDGTFIRTWEGYSQTTMKHVNQFREMCGLPKINKAIWEKMNVQETEEF